MQEKGKRGKRIRKGNQETLIKKHCSYYREIETFTALRIPRKCPLLPSENRELDTKVKCLAAKR
jgi:hypothetical protein